MKRILIEKKRIEKALGVGCRRLRSVGGGCIATSVCADLEDGRRVFCKSMGSGDPAVLCEEARGLRALAASDTVSVPRVLHEADDLLVMDWIEPARSFSTSHQQNLGRALARLHRISVDFFGFSHDNFIGRTPQGNTPPRPWNEDDATGGWADFYADMRLRRQIGLARRNGLATAELTDGVERICGHLTEILGEAREHPCLLHGDLWGGNVIAADDGAAYVVDPACYWGHREADLAMTELFGGFSREFYATYRAEYPLNNGYERRAEVYKLYHLLNHLNLFGNRVSCGVYGGSAGNS